MFFIQLFIKDFLFQGIVLKEKEFRLSLKDFDFSNYANKTVALNCSADAIVPMWAFMLVTSYLNSINADIHFGGKEDVFQQIFNANIDAIDSSEFENKKVIVKGWVKTFRANRFISLNDGSCLENIQCVVDFENMRPKILEKINTGTSLKIYGSLIKSMGKGQSLEIKVSDIKILGECDIESYPIQPKKQT